MIRSPGAKRDERVVLIVGASSGIGRASAEAFAGQGARLVLASRNQTLLDEVAADCDHLGATATLAIATDINDRDQVGRCVGEAVRTFGRIDVVVLTAAVMAYGSIESVPPAVFERVVDTALHGTANVARAVLPVFRDHGGGNLIIVNSLLGQVPVPQMGAYVSSKWGQLGLIRVLQLETRGESGIHISAISPGSVATPIFKAAANYTGWVGRAPPPVSPVEKLARSVLKRADRPRKSTSVGPANAITTLGYRLLPPVYDLLVTPLMKVGVLTNEPSPPTEGNVFSPAGSDHRDVESAR